MDPDRVRSYLQVACAGLGFDIGEIWWTQNESGTSTLATIEEKKDEQTAEDNQGSRKKRFVQLYTSKSYEDKRAELVSPERHEEEESEGAIVRTDPCTPSELEKHKLSPQLVDAISKSAQVVWANCEKQEGLLGRSDMRLQTAVGMPVAVDAEGNMCVVVMFSPENLESTDEAMEYLQFISKSATSSSIPCLLPVFDSKTMRPALMSHAHDEHVPDAVAHPPDPSFGKDITAHYCFIDDADRSAQDSIVHSDHDVTGAPKDCFGIPMLPSFAELGGTGREEDTRETPSPLCDPFDEASFGVWATIMHTPEEAVNAPTTDRHSHGFAGGEQSQNGNGIPRIEPIADKPLMQVHRRERLEEFCSAFLQMSLFDASDVWMPVGGEAYGTLGHVTSSVSTETNASLTDFVLVSQYSQIKLWSGAVGRAFASGNPVWSANFDVIADTARVAAFQKANIKTALAVPIFSSGSVSPACVLCCYSLVRAEAVPAVLRFVQQALRLLWTGLDKVEPHQSIGRDLWKDVAPADLGEMAADVEMQHTFLKKRTHSFISASPDKFSMSLSVPAVTARERSSSLSEQLHSIETASPLQRTRPLQSALSVQMNNLAVSANPSSADIPNQPQSVLPRHQAEVFSTMLQNHLQDAVRSVGGAVPWSAHQHLDTNSEGTKRAHVFAPGTGYERTMDDTTQSEEQQTVSASNGTAVQGLPQPMPLQMPRTLAMHIPPTQVSAGSDAQRGSAGVPALQDHILGAASIPVQCHPVNGGPPPPVYLPEYTPSITGIKFGVSSDASIGQAHDLSAVQCPVVASSMSTKTCRIQGCDDIAVARRPYCLKHSGNRLCEHPGCTKCAQGSTRFCIAHGGGRRCTFPGCDKGARDKFFCAAHGGGKRCTYEGCSKSAVGGSNLCTSHGGGRRCAVAGCNKSAQSSTKFCVKHGGGKKCAYAGCEKVARGRTQFCAAHGGGVRCKLEGCNRVAIGKLQLCRTHGGGSRSSKSSNHAPTPPPSAQLHAL